MEAFREARFGLTPGRLSLADRPRGVPGFGFGLPLPGPLGLPSAPDLAASAAAVRRLAFSPAVDKVTPNGARAEPCPAFSSPSA